MVYINAISYYLPEKSFSNKEIIEEYQNYCDPSKFLPITEEDIFKQCGINTRYAAEIEETAKDVGNKSALKLFEEWNIDKNTIEYLIFVSDALDYKGPTTACVMQYDLGLPETCATIDVLHGCTGYIYGLSLAKALISSGQVNNVLIVTADTPTKVVHPADIDLRAIFSDAGATTLVSNKKLDKSLNFEISNFIFGTDGKGEKNLFVERSATKNAADIAWLQLHEHLPGGLRRGRMIMNSPQIFLFALRKVPLLIEQVLKKNNLTFEEIDYFVLHQANGQMLEFIRKKLKIPQEKFIINIEHVGNTVSATIPIALKEMIDDTKYFSKGNKILVGGFGIGYSWGATILTI
ncbi:MAG: 3-oxoacyl-[acyl-carrier-protein] synthase 3 [Flavobacteriales bacterium]|nr:3-oxoacyl-[acyl-carrier-protein] synthase 3 [Flavobacteriales bacterium]